jgi:acetolactate synthase I/II/III large subunit
MTSNLRAGAALDGDDRKESEVGLSSGTRAAAVPEQTTVSDALVQVLQELGIRQSFGLVGGTIAPFCEALARSSMGVFHCRHETGAAFAAAEASLATGRPVAIFTTSGPGLLNSVNGLMAARWEGARVVLVSGTTAPASRGRWAFQETSAHTMPDGLFHAGKLFHYAVEILEADQLHDAAECLRAGVLRPEGFVAHVALPSSLQTQAIRSRGAGPTEIVPRGVGAPLGEAWAKVFSKGPLLVWVGFGARTAATEVRALVERTDARVICSPRGKGIFPEDHPQFVGVSGFAGRPDLSEAIAERPPQTLLVLGSRLGEFTSFWDRDVVPRTGIVHVDVDAAVPGAAFPDVPTRAVHAEIGEFLRSVLAHLPGRPSVAATPVAPRASGALRPVPVILRADGPVRPQALMEAIQRVVIDGTDHPLLVDVGNAFAWATSLLRFKTAGRFRVTMGWGSMGQATAGVVGVALATDRKAVALVGDGALLMQNEISTAVHYGARAVWIVLNDSQYGMIEQGMRGLRMVPTETQIPAVDFVALAQSLGAGGAAVKRETELDAVLRAAVRADRPFVVDVTIDRRELAPMGLRVKNLIAQGVEGTTDDAKR